MQIAGAILSAAFSPLLRLLSKLWQHWQLHLMVLFSLIMQLVLALFGNRRKFQGRASRYVAFIDWSAYMLADWAATLTLSTLVKGSKEIVSDEMVILWTPFLLLHLGGPDAISAYSLFDNKLWRRRLLGLFIQTGVALYVFVRYLKKDVVLPYMYIPLLMGGMIRYGERCLMLFCANNTVPLSDFMFRNLSKKADDPRKKSQALQELVPAKEKLEDYLERACPKPKYRYVHQAYIYYKMFLLLFSDFTIRIYQDFSYVFSMTMPAEEAFKIVETELGFLYDMLYTKMLILQNRVFVVFRCIYLLFNVCVLVIFSINFRRGHSKPDTAVTYCLIVGAIFVDVYSSIGNLVSDWALLMWSRGNWKGMAKFVVNYCVRAFDSGKDKMGAGIQFMAQHSLIDYSLNPKLCGIWERYSWEKIDLDLKKQLYSHLQKKRQKYEKDGFKFMALSKMLEQRGESVIKERVLKESVDNDAGNGVVNDDGVKIWDEFKWSISDVGFTHSLLLWHVATHLVFHADDGIEKGRAADCPNYREISKLLSEYMMYLLAVRPFMLPADAMREKRIEDTRADLKCRIDCPNDKISKKKETSMEIANALLQIDFQNESCTADASSGIKKESMSVLPKGVELTKELQKLMNDPEVNGRSWEYWKKWEMISGVWMEMLCYAASQCEWEKHAEELRHGGELLTHVALLMAHLGLTKRIHIVERPREYANTDKVKWDWNNVPNLDNYHFA